MFPFHLHNATLVLKKKKRQESTHVILELIFNFLIKLFIFQIFLSNTVHLHMPLKPSFKDCFQKSVSNCFKKEFFFH